MVAVLLAIVALAAVGGTCTHVSLARVLGPLDAALASIDTTMPPRAATREARSR